MKPLDVMTYAANGEITPPLGSGDRRAIADLTYGAVRRLRSAAWVAGAGENPSGREVMLGSLILDGSDFTAFFSGVGHAPQPLTPAETARLGQPLVEVVAVCGAEREAAAGLAEQSQRDVDRARQERDAMLRHRVLDAVEDGVVGLRKVM